MKRTIARVVLGLFALAFCVCFPGVDWSGGHSSAASILSVSKGETVTGELEVIAECEDNGGQILYYLKTDKERLKVKFSSEPEQKLETGMHVTMKGSRNGDVLTTDETSVQVESSFSSALQNTFGEHKVAVILVNFQDLQTQPYTPAQAQDMTFNTTSNFFRENSYGQTWLTGDVYGWFTIPVNSTSCDTSAIATYAQQAAAKAGADLSAYNHIVYAFPQISACTFSGRSSVGGSPSQSWINADHYGIEVLGHELGHGFGLLHSRSLDCGSTVVGVNCVSSEYGDKFDIMGASMPAHFNLFQKERLGWVGPGSPQGLTTITASGNYWIAAYETATSETKGLKILRSIDPATGLKTWYYLEHRTSAGSDSILSYYRLENGVVFHSGSESSGQEIYQLDMTPDTPSWYDSILAAGQTYSDAQTGTSISVLSSDNSGAWVQVSIASQPCAHSNPIVSISPGQTQWLRSGSSFTYTVTVSNTESGGCSTATYNMLGNAPVGWAALYAASTMNIAPGASASTSLNVTSAAGAADGSYGIAAIATNGTYNGTADASYTIVSALSINAVSGASNYSRTQRAIVTATVLAAGAVIPGASITFTMTKPNSTVVTQSATTSSNGTAVFSYSFNKRQDPTGTYQLKAVGSSNGVAGQGTANFLVNK
jgi:M6 family metalloprotease-like protein